MKPGMSVLRMKAMAKEDEKAPGDVIMSRFRCADINCNKLFTEVDHKQGFCGGCQGIRFLIARYITDDEVVAIEKGEIVPHEVNLDVVGVEPPSPREVR